VHSERGLTYIEVVLSGHMYVSCIQARHCKCLTLVKDSSILTMVRVPKHAVLVGIQADAVTVSKLRMSQIVLVLFLASI
jgi:hypothetical protein